MIEENTLVEIRSRLLVLASHFLPSTDHNFESVGGSVGHGGCELGGYFPSEDRIQLVIVRILMFLF
jgi:hypothetical protein